MASHFAYLEFDSESGALIECKIALSCCISLKLM